MKKLVLVALMSVIALWGFGGSAFAKKPVVLRLAEIHDANYPTTIVDFEIAKLVKQRTRGRVVIEVYHSMKLGDEAAVIKKVQEGEIDLTRISIGPVTKYVPALNAFHMPYVFRDTEHLLEIINGEIGDEVLNSVEKSAFIGFGWFDGGTRNFYTKRPIRTPADIKGMRIRTVQSQLMAAMIEAMGAVAVPMPHGETYAALKSGAVDGAENSYPTYEEAGHYQLARYFLQDEHTRSPDIIIGSLKSLATKLSVEDIEIIKQAARETRWMQFKLWAEAVMKAKNKVIAAGCSVSVPTPSQRQAFIDAARPVYDAQPATIKELVNRIKEVR
jgi:tripartite ATP-independent transporter DctP family solute receptor